MTNPFYEDISTCEFLLRYCKKIIKDREQKANKVIKDNEAKEETAKKNEELKKQAEDGKIMFIKSKEERNKEDLIIIGGKGKRKKNRNKRRKNQHKAEEAREARDPNELSFSYEIIQNFGEVGIDAPSQFDELKAKIEELEAKRREFFEKGEKQLDDQFLNQNQEQTPVETQEKEDDQKEDKVAFNVEEEDEENWPAMQ